jgi:hypothetical protein
MYGETNVDSSFQIYIKMIYWKTKTKLGVCLQYGLLVAVIVNFILFAIFTLTHRYLQTHAVVIINPFLGTNLSLIHVQNFGLSQNLNDKPLHDWGDGIRIRTSETGVHSTALMDPYAYKRNTPVIVTRNLTCNGCFKYNYDYLIENTNICSNTTELVFLIASATEGFKERDALRNTWLNFSRAYAGVVRHVFLLGSSSKGSVNDMIVDENERNRDIIQGSFLDTYGNLTLKTRMGLKWVVEACSYTKYVMKTDDDMWVNVANVMSALLPQYGRMFHSHIGGFCMRRETPHRDPKSKYYIPQSLFNRDYFPPFCSGTGYVTSSAMVKKIYQIADNVPYFPLEDVYVGLCLEQLKLDVVKINSFYNYSPRFKFPCWYKGPNVFTVHGLSPERLVEIWNSRCYAKQSMSVIPKQLSLALV